MIRLLLVNDSPVFRQGLAILLKNDFPEFEIVGEASGESEAIARVERLKPDVVIMDIFMKNGDSIEVIQRMHEKFPELKLLILSVSDESDDLFRAIKAGASAYLLTTTDLKELSESIRTVATGESVLSPPLLSKLVKEFRTGANERNQHLYILTRREKEILRFAAQGYSNKEIAERCFISLTTVKAHFRNILGKLEVKNRTGAVALANAYRLLDTTTEDSVPRFDYANHPMDTHSPGVFQQS